MPDFLLWEYLATRGGLIALGRSVRSSGLE